MRLATLVLFQDYRGGGFEHLKKKKKTPEKCHIIHDIPSQFGKVGKSNAAAWVTRREGQTESAI
jgi:hypothetical protein